MKHLIIEAPDRCGKDTLIKNLMPFCQNLVITHFSTPLGETDLEKRKFQEESFKQEFGKAYWFMKSDFFATPKKGKMNLLIWNRAHLGEFVYGNLYRQTNPEEWVMKLEEDYEYDNMENVYLLLLTGDPEFLSSRDDGESFNGSVEARKKEIANFKNAFDQSKIKKKMVLDVTTRPEVTYKSQELILQEVLQFLNT
jgi:hypothetical protein